MYTIEEFCYIMDQKKPDIMTEMKKGNYVDQNVTTPDQMNSKERAVYDERTKTLMNKYHKMKNWRKLLGINSRYKKPYLANAEALLLSNGKNVNIAKMDEELAPSDSESDYNSASESDSERSYEDIGDDDDSIMSDSQEQEQTTESIAKVDGEIIRRTLSQKETSLAMQKQRRQQRDVKDKPRMNKQLYVMPCFLKPGKQTMIVQSQMYETDLQNNQTVETNARNMMRGDKGHKKLGSIDK